MRDTLFVDGVCLADYGLVLTDVRTETAPVRVVERIAIPGRSGALHIDRGRFENVTVEYSFVILREFSEKFAALRALLLSKAGYRRLEDTMHPEEYRMGACLDGIEPELYRFLQTGTFPLKFDCAPQRYLKSGEYPVMLSAPGVLYNSTAFVSKPLIAVTGSGAGSLTVGGVTVSILSLDGSLSLDCDTQNAYKGHQNKNNTISAPVFPVLSPGENQISWTGGVTGVEVTPRWWTL